MRLSSRWRWIGWALGLGWLAATTGFAAHRPNVLLLFADDQRADTISAWGNPAIETPNLDRLVARGFSFRRNYCFGSNSGAVCVPSRAMLMSGRTWLDVKADLSGTRLLPEVLREAGYATFATGKWHNGEASFVRGFPEGRSVFFGGMADHTQVPVRDVTHGVVGPKRTASKFSSEEFADAAIGFLTNASVANPFFCYVAFTAPHDPRNPPEAFRERYYRRRPPLPENFLPLHPFDQGFARDLRDENLAAYPRTPGTVGDQLCEYYGLITHLDEQVGRILAALAASPQGTNTVVIYAADHGLALGSHGLLGKQSVYEHSMRCPLIVAGPGVPAGGSTHAFTYLLDLFPTITGLADVPPLPGLAGESLQPLWTGARERIRDSVFLPFTDTMRAVRDERWKLIVYPQIGRSQLFDLQADPFEKRDLAADASFADQRTRLLTLMRDWQQRVGDRQALTVPEPKSGVLNLDGYVRRPDEWQPRWIVEKYF
ncbi:MAG: hypothetical protein RIS76_2073 [Verrucomicrobiota bacterium]|jgi:arylsulfatase A-like enzyme